MGGGQSEDPELLSKRKNLGSEGNRSLLLFQLGKAGNSLKIRIMIILRITTKYQYYYYYIQYNKTNLVV